MVTSCCAFGCSYRFKKGLNIRLHRFPKERNKKIKWIIALKRKDWQPSSGSRVCSQHFQTGKPSEDQNHPDYVPNVFCFATKKITAVKYEQRKEKLLRRKRPECPAEVQNPSTNEETELANILLMLSNGNVTSIPIADPKTLEVQQKHEIHIRDEEIYALRAERDLYKEMVTETWTNKMLNNSSSLLYYTGLPKTEVFNYILNILKDDIKLNLTISKEKQLMMVLIKLKLALDATDIAYRFQSSRRTVQRVFDIWIPALAKKLAPFIRWPDRSSLYQHIPSCFKGTEYEETVAVIDCTEIFMEKAGNQNAKSETWSSYKHHQTVKILIAITPGGSISYVSNVWGGRASDREITVNCGILKLISAGDLILADRGFQLKDEFAAIGAKLIVPSFIKGKKQLSLAEVLYSKQVSNVRIHVERVIRVIKKF